MKALRLSRSEQSSRLLGGDQRTMHDAAPRKGPELMADADHQMLFAGTRSCSAAVQVRHCDTPKKSGKLHLSLEACVLGVLPTNHSAFMKLIVPTTPLSACTKSIDHLIFPSWIVWTLFLQGRRRHPIFLPPPFIESRPPAGSGSVTAFGVENHAKELMLDDIKLRMEDFI